MVYNMEKGKKRLDYLKEIRGILPEKNKEFVTYLMYGSFRRVQVVKNNEEKLIRVQKRSPEGYFSTIEAEFNSVNDDFPQLLLDECERVLKSTDELRDTLKDEGKSDEEIKKRVTLIRLLASKIKDDISKFNKFY